MASSLFGPSPKPRSNAAGLHPVLRNYQEALQRGDPRAREAQQLLSLNSPQQLQRVAMNMLQSRGLSPEAVLKQLGLR